METLMELGTKIISIFEAIMGMDFTSEIIPMLVMWAIGGVLIYCAIAKDMEPTLLLPMGFGTILVNLPLALTEGVISEHGAIEVLYNAGVSNELFPLLLFIGIGAMIDFGPVLSNPKLMFFGAASQFGIFFTLWSAYTVYLFRRRIFKKRYANAPAVIWKDEA